MISIIIPAYNKHAMTSDCIRAVRKNTEDYEIILVDNGSDPIYEEATIRNNENLGFPVAVNQGIRAASGDIIVLLNNDVIVTPEWADRLKYHLNEYSIVAPMTNYCAGIQQIKLKEYKNRKELNAIASEYSTLHDGMSEEVNYIIGFCMAFPKALYEELGGFDESLWPCSGEEIDFCLRARDRGHKVGIAKDVYVHHFGSQTFTEMDKTGQVKYNEVIRRNNQHLKDKWGNDFHKQTIKTKEDSLKEQKMIEVMRSVKLGIGIPLSFPMIPAAFFDSFTMMAKGINWTYIRSSAGQIDDLRNEIVREAQKASCTHVIMMDTDQTYDPMTIPRLLAHQKPVVGCLVYRRYPPFDPLMLKGEPKSYKTIDEWEQDELVEVDATGTGCLMFDMKVFDSMPYPWFKTVRENGKVIVGEDIGFCHELRKAGHKIYVDTSIPCGHLSQLCVSEGTWKLYRKLKQAEIDANKAKHGVLETAVCV